MGRGPEKTCCAFDIRLPYNDSPVSLTMMIQDNINPAVLATSLLAWYDRMGRDLPWRVKGEPHPKPYYVWLSEVMLQQTTVATVKSYFTAFIQKWPTIQDFAAASLDEILHAWQGLGYYARARNMHKCARLIVSEHKGEFPATAALLARLPGIGPYTAAAIASIAFEEKITPVDGNVMRVLSRLYALQDPVPASIKRVYSLTQKLTPHQRTGDFAQALMDLGATLCTPRTPKCLLCPWQTSCQGFKQGIAEELPRKSLKTIKPDRYAVAFVISRGDGSVLLARREEKGLLGGMIEAPTTPWREKPWPLDEALAFCPLECEWKENTREVRHVFTHFNFKVVVCYGAVLEPVSLRLPRSFWVKPEDFSKMALPTVMKKILSTLTA